MAPILCSRRYGIGIPYVTGRTASKLPLVGVTSVQACELASTGVHAKFLHLKQIDADLEAYQQERTPELVEKLIAMIPIRRVGDPLEVAGPPSS